MSKRVKEILIAAAVVIFIAAAVLFIVKIAGCGSKSIIPSLTYTADENREDWIYITGLTDKGRSDSVIKIPAQLDGKTVAGIAREAFRDCSNLKEVIIEEGITEIAENAFFNCVNLENIEIPSTVKKIGTNAVKNTAWQKNKASSEYIIVNDILIEANTVKETYIIPEGVKRIASGVFYSNNRVREITLPSEVEYIESYAFAGCGELSQINIPNSVKVIEYGAFSGCSSLSVEVPETVENVGVDAFLNVEQLQYKGKLAEAPWGAKSYIK